MVGMKFLLALLQLASAVKFRAGSNSSAQIDTFIDNYLRSEVVQFTESGKWEADFTGCLEVLVVGGGGGGGGRSGGGGAGGGLIHHPCYQVTKGTKYDVVVGAGGDGGKGNAGLGAKSDGKSGQDSKFADLVAKGGGGGGSDGTAKGKDGGSGGGGKYGKDGGKATQPTQSGDSGAYGSGHAGGFGTEGTWNAGGGGGAGSKGTKGTDSKCGNGGAGKEICITGTCVMYAGGGGGGSHDPACSSGGKGGDGGGGACGTPGGRNPGQAGRNGLGGGGGGGSTPHHHGGKGGNGGNGIVILKKNVPGPASWTFTEDSTWTATFSGCAKILVVGGGGGGGGRSGGGGAGGGLVTMDCFKVTKGTPYTIKVGAGGAGGSAGGGDGKAGKKSKFGELVAKGGGGGGSDHQKKGYDGGSGGGGKYGKKGGKAVQTSQSGKSGKFGFGHKGGSGTEGTWNAGGGGGAGEVGESGTSSHCGDGGKGKEICILGTCDFYAAGGGGGSHNPKCSSGGEGGEGGGGDCGTPGGKNPGAHGEDGKGSGGGGGSTTSGSGGKGGNGGKGIVIIEKQKVSKRSCYDLPMGDRFIQLGEWRMAAIDDTHFSISHKDGKTAQIFRADGTLHPGQSAWGSWDRKIGEPKEITFGDGYIEIGNFRIGAVDETHLSIAHKGGKTEQIYQSDGTLHPGPRSDWSTYDKSFGKISVGDRFIQFGKFRVGDVDGRHFTVIHESGPGRTIQIYRDDGTLHPGPRDDWQQLAKRNTRTWCQTLPAEPDDGKCPGKKTSGDCDELTDQATCDGAYMAHHGMFVRCGWKTNDQCLSKSDCE